MNVSKYSFILDVSINDSLFQYSFLHYKITQYKKNSLHSQYLTGDPTYREWGWEVFQSIEKYCKTSVAYGGVKNVEVAGTPPQDSMESFFLAETMKYLYLLFDPDTEIDILSRHVFNTEAHPLRVFDN